VLARELGMLTDEEGRVLERRTEEEERIVEAARGAWLDPEDVNGYLDGLGESQVTVKKRIIELIKRPKTHLRRLFACGDGEIPDAHGESWISAQVELKYSGYLAREREAARKLAELAGFRLPGDLDYAGIQSISTEARQKLSRVRPESLAQAGRIPGVSPSDLQNLVLEVLKRRRAA
jgi:tRNA uridine 5-carboxymethylaminomethyl modification enzyme